ncbi:MAG: helix-turn-helix domain-containing protein [Clostridiales bacterium]|nr:helix-turn-helix domain-containing protein [Clostridiales bacterium]MCD8384680.1 helix-turn-helix domain-containing protein [Clostridiales bacterium]
MKSRLVYTSLDDLPVTLRMDEVAAVLKVSRNTAYALVRRGVLPSLRIGRCLRVPKQSLLSFLRLPPPSL